MKTAFRKPPEWHGDDGTQWGYVNLGHVTHFVIDTGEIGFVGGKVSTIAEPQCEEMAKALEAFEKSLVNYGPSFLGCTVEEMEKMLEEARYME